MRNFARGAAIAALTVASAALPLAGTASAAELPSAATIAASGTKYCGEFVTYDSCVMERNDWTRRGYGCSDVQGPYGKLGYYFHWEK